MRRVAVDSSVIASVGYSARDATLEIEFTSGRVYQFFDVPADEHRDLMAADSHGSYFNSMIRNCYPYASCDRGAQRWTRRAA